MTQLSATVVILSLHYLWLLKRPKGSPARGAYPSTVFDNVNPEPGSEYMVAVVALMLANKVLDE